MKRIMTILMAMVALCGTPLDSYASNGARGVSAALDVTYTFYDTSALEDGAGAKIRLGYEGLYAWASQERTARIYHNQKVMKLDVAGYGIGGEFEVFKDITLSAEIGKYKPHKKTPSSLWIGIPWYRVGGSGEYVNYLIEDGYGGSVGAHYHKALSKHWSIRAGAMYRYLKLKETLYGLDEVAFSFFTIPDGARRSTKFSGLQLSFGIAGEF